MMRALALALFGPALLLIGIARASAQSAAAAAPRPLRVHLISGSAEYKSDQSLADLQKHLESAGGAVCTRSFAKDKGNDIPGLEALDQAEVMVLFTRRLSPTAEQLARLKKWFAAGKPCVGIRTASHAFQNWLEFDKEVLHGNYQGHYGKDEPAQVKPAETAKDHPVLTGVPAFTTLGKLYKNPDFDPRNTLLLSATSAAGTQPVAWVRTHNGGRIFYTSLGTPADFREPAFRTLLSNAIFWAGGQ